MDELLTELKQRIVEHLEIDDVSPEEIGADDPLFVEGLGLDSIDAVELVVMVERHYAIKLEQMETAKAAFQSVRTLAEFITANRSS